MKLRVVTIGKPALEFARLGILEYSKRLAACAEFELLQLKPGTKKNDPMVKLLRAPEPGDHFIALDESGESMGSTTFSHRLERLQDTGIRRITMFVGGGEGLPDEVLRDVHLRLCLGRMTMQHELAAVVLLEQLYRAITIQQGSPYHREGRLADRM